MCVMAKLGECKMKKLRKCFAIKKEEFKPQRNKATNQRKHKERQFFKECLCQ